MNIEIRKLGKDELHLFRELLQLFEDVFEMNNFVMPPGDYLQQLLEKNDFGVFVALSGGVVTGGLTTYSLQQYYRTTPLVYIYDMAVSREFQRKGIGKKLITGLKDLAAHREWKKCWCRPIKKTTTHWSFTAPPVPLRRKLFTSITG